jgi:uncharacterized protein YkwD
MRRVRLLIIVAISLFTLIAPTHFAAAQSVAQPAAATKNVQLSPQMTRIVELVNQRRSEAGLAPVTVHPTLMTCAQQYSEVQASLGRIDHTGPDGSTPGQRLTRCGYRWKHYGENLAAGYVDADEVMAAWMASPSHRRNILNPKFREIGLGFAHRDDDPSQYFDYYVMELGTRK